jgi:hypothetical protein
VRCTRGKKQRDADNGEHGEINKTYEARKRHDD